MKSTNRFATIRDGLLDAIAHAEGEPDRGVVHRIQIPEIDVAGLRAKLGMSQERFARTFGVSVGTVRGWEQGRRRPEGAARVLLTVIDKETEAVKRALGVQTQV
jgi:putative transcriptional regulator